MGLVSDFFFDRQTNPNPAQRARGYGCGLLLVGIPFVVLALLVEKDTQVFGFGVAIVSVIVVIALEMGSGSGSKITSYDSKPAYKQKEESRKQEAKNKSNEVEQQRRENARVKVELYYNQHAPEIGARYSKDMFDVFLKKYMGNEKSAEEVEQRSQQLLEMLEKHRLKVEPQKSENNLENILASFEQRMNKIRAADMHPNDKETLLISLDEQREAAIRKAASEGTL